MISGRAAAPFLSALILAGCAGGQYALTDKPPAGYDNGGMNGRWMLAAPNAPPCGMTFAAAASGSEGGVTPDGGCPGRLFLSRRWTLGGNGLTIVGPNGEELAVLKPAEGRYEGKSTGGLSVTLTRAASPPG
ncbi:MAG: AprI/Inh family metalloprotease inhibitor [Pseudolabrys sp.]